MHPAHPPVPLPHPHPHPHNPHRSLSDEHTPVDHYSRSLVRPAPRSSSFSASRAPPPRWDNYPPPPPVPPLPRTLLPGFQSPSLVHANLDFTFTGAPQRPPQLPSSQASASHGHIPPLTHSVTDSILHWHPNSAVSSPPTPVIPPRPTTSYVSNTAGLGERRSSSHALAHKFRAYEQPYSPPPTVPPRPSTAHGEIRPLIIHSQAALSTPPELQEPSVSPAPPIPPKLPISPGIPQALSSRLEPAPSPPVRNNTTDLPDIPDIPAPQTNTLHLPFPDSGHPPTPPVEDIPGSSPRGLLSITKDKEIEPLSFETQEPPALDDFKRALTLSLAESHQKRSVDSSYNKEDDELARALAESLAFSKTLENNESHQRHAHSSRGASDSKERVSTYIAPLHADVQNLVHCASDSAGMSKMPPRRKPSVQSSGELCILSPKELQDHEAHGRILQELEDEEMTRKLQEEEFEKLARQLEERVRRDEEVTKQLQEEETRILEQEIREREKRDEEIAQRDAELARKEEAEEKARKLIREAQEREDAEMARRIVETGQDKHAAVYPHASQPQSHLYDFKTPSTHLPPPASHIQAPPPHFSSPATHGQASPSNLQAPPADFQASPQLFRAPSPHFQTSSPHFQTSSPPFQVSSPPFQASPPPFQASPPPFQAPPHTGPSVSHSQVPGPHSQSAPPLVAHGNGHSTAPAPGAPGLPQYNDFVSPPEPYSRPPPRNVQSAPLLDQQPRPGRAVSAHVSVPADRPESARSSAANGGANQGRHDENQPGQRPSRSPSPGASGHTAGPSKAAHSPPVDNAVEPGMLKGVSYGFKRPDLRADFPQCPPFPEVITLSRAPSPPFHIMAPSWRHLMRLLAQLETHLEASIDVIARTKEESHLRVVIQFAKLPYTANSWRTILHLTLDEPIPQNTLNAWRFTNGDSTVLPYSYTLTGTPPYLASNAISQLYVIPLSANSPFPILPISLPNLALYLQSAMRDSRARKVQNDQSNGMRRLARIVALCYPDDVIVPDKEEKKPSRGVGGLLRRVVGRGGEREESSNNEEIFDVITPFRIDQYS